MLRTVAPDQILFQWLCPITQRNSFKFSLQGKVQESCLGNFFCFAKTVDDWSYKHIGLSAFWGVFLPKRWFFVFKLTPFFGLMHFPANCTQVSLHLIRVRLFAFFRSQKWRSTIAPHWKPMQDVVRLGSAVALFGSDICENNSRFQIKNKNWFLISSVPSKTNIPFRSIKNRNCLPLWVSFFKETAASWDLLKTAGQLSFKVKRCSFNDDPYCSNP